MSFFEFPHARTYDNDLGWLIARVIRMSKQLENFINFNTIKYADPIAWNITTQYEANTVVINPADGTAYISTQPVPSGVLITNTEYWTPIFNYAESMDKLREQIAAANDGENPNTTAPRTAGDLVWLNGLLYIVTADMAAGTTYIQGVNIEPITIEEYINNLDDAVKTEIYNRIFSLSVYANVRYYGAAGDGVTDDSAAFQEAIDSGRPVFVPAGTYVVREAVKTSGDFEILGGVEAEVIPVYVGGVAQRIFYITDCDDVRIRNLKIGGVKHGVTNYNVYRQSALDVENCKKITVENCVFKTIDDSITEIVQPMRQRKGVAASIHDVDMVIFDGCIFDDLGSDEIIWITNYNKDISEMDIVIANCASRNLYGLSLFDCIANSVNVDNLISDASDDLGNNSYVNFTCSNVRVRRSRFYGKYGDIIDTCEASLFFADSVYISECEFYNYKMRAIKTIASEIVIEKCYDSGNMLYYCINTVATIQQYIDNFGANCYLTYKPCKLIVIRNCNHDSNLDNASIDSAFLVNTQYAGGDLIVEGNIVDQHDVKGSAVYTNGVKNLIVKDNNFFNAGVTVGNSSYKAFVEISTNTENVSLVGNHLDEEGLCSILTAGVKHLKISGNVRDIDNAYLVRNYVATYKVENLVTDDSTIEVYADNYGNAADGAIYSVPWLAQSTSAADTPLTYDLTLERGLWLIYCPLPSGTSDVLYVMYDLTHNRTIAKEYGKSYGVMVAFVALTGTTKIRVQSGSGGSSTFSATNDCRLSAVFIKN